MKKSFLSLVAVAVASSAYANGVPDQAPPVNATQVRAVRTQTVLVKECTTDSFGNTTCRLVPRTETVYAAVDTQAPVQAPPVAAVVVKAATVAETVSAVHAFPAVHAVRIWFKDRPKLFHGRLAKRLRGENNCE